MPTQEEPLPSGAGAGRFVFLACPCGDGRLDMKTAFALISAAMTVKCRIHFSARSALANNFNFQWTECLNAAKEGTPFTHFVMLHSDVYPVQQDWLTRFLDEMDRVDADVLSAIIPIKDHWGVTSTAIDLGRGRDWGRRRLTMREIDLLPETFDRRLIHAKIDVNGTLLVNTGLFAVDLRKSWPMREIAFTQQDRVIELNGKLIPAFEPEDWDFAKQVERLGASVYATRKVTVHHIGRWEFPNFGAWGLAHADPALFPNAVNTDAEIIAPMD